MRQHQKILLLDNYDSFTYNIAQILRGNGCEFDIIKNDKLSLLRAEKYNKIIFSPGPGIPRDAPVMYDILEKYAGSKSILGICLGHQAIADYFGWEVVNLPGVYHGIRECVKIVQDDLVLYDGVPEEFDAGLYHSWAVSASGDAPLDVTAVSREGVIMSIKHKTLDVRGVQFHPESHMTEQGGRILANWLRR